MKVSEMPWPELRNWLRLWGPEIARLARNGDKTAQKVYNIVCEVTYGNLPLTHPMHAELRVAIEDYLQRDLNISDRNELGSKFGHLLEEKESGPRIVVPGTVTKQ